MPTSDSATDEQLAQRASRGSRDAFAELVTRYGSRVRSVLGRAANDDHLADDLTQEVWVKVLGALPRFRPDGSFRSWLFSIALNHLRDALRARRRSRLVFVDDVGEQAPGVEPDSAAEHRDERRAVEAALAGVDEPFRSAVSLVDLAGLSYAEAAASLGCTLGTVKSRVHRGRLAFRDQYLRRDGRSVDASRQQHDACGSMP